MLRIINYAGYSAVVNTTALLIFHKNDSYTRVHSMCIKLERKKKSRK